MTLESFGASLRDEISGLKSSFEDKGDHFLLDINGKEIQFLKCSSNFSVQPNAWLTWKNEHGQVHEPGMVAAIHLLSKSIKTEVIFYDVGALFGYFSFVSSAFFENARCKIVEGNPYSADCIKQISGNRSDFTVMNAVVGLERGRKRFFVTGFKFIEVGSLSGQLKRATIAAKNVLKRLANAVGAKFKLVEGQVFDIDEIALPDIFEPKDPATVEIFKIDTEGFQGLFLPPFIDELCARNPIVLLELDRPDMMAQFGTTNDAMLQLFRDRGFEAVWLDHRIGKGVAPVERISAEQDKNSLCIIMPARFFA